MCRSLLTYQVGNPLTSDGWVIILKLVLQVTDFKFTLNLTGANQGICS